MDAFHVTCETCHARLKIRSESVIGQIHACPKCESMVHIVPPAGWKPTTPSAASSTFIPSMEEVPANLPVAGAGSSLLVWSLGGAALAVVIGVAGVLWTRGNEPTESPVAALNSEPATPPESPAAPEKPAENVELAADTLDAADEPVAPLPANVEIDPQSAEPDAEPATVPELPGADIAVAAPAAADSNAPPAPSPPSADAKKPVLKFDPLDFDPSQLSLGGTTAPSAAATNSFATDANAEPIVVEASDNLPPAQKPAEPAIGDPSVTVRLGPQPTDARQSRKVAEQLALNVDSINLAAMPLARFVDTVSEMGNVAITIDPTALEMAGVSPRATVDIRGGNMSLEKLLRDGLAKVRLDFVDRDGRVVIIHPSRNTRRSVDYDVKDLVTDGANDATALSEMIQRFVAPDSWRADAEGGTIRVDGSKLHVEHVNGVQMQVLMFCERLRLARGLAPRSRYPAERLSIESPYATISAKLDRPTTFTFLPWTRLADVVRHWQEATGVTILVDWEALASEELAPATPIACSAINRPWQAAFDAVLEPLGLGWWAIDSETIQITSRTALGQLEQIEFYPLPKGQNSIDDVAADGATRVERDAPSGRLIVLSSPDVQRILSGRLGNSLPQRHDEHDGIRTNATPVGTP